MVTPSRGKTVSEAKSRRLGTVQQGWGYVKDHSNILILDAGSGWIEAVSTGNRTSETAEVHLSQIFARHGIPKTLVSGDGPEFVW